MHRRPKAEIAADRPSTAEHASDIGPRILIIDAVMPDPSRDSGSMRLCHIIQLIRQMGWHVDFLPDSLHADAESIAILEAFGARTLCRPLLSSLPNFLHQHGSAYQGVMLCRHYVAWPHLPLIRRYAPAARVLFDTVDLHHVREMRAARQSGSAWRMRQACRSRRRELRLVQRCDTTFVVSSAERQWLEQSVPEADVRLLSNIHHVHPNDVDFEDRQDLIFVGGWAHPPNRDAIHWLAKEIMPLIRRRLPEVTLHLVGDLPEAARGSLRQPGVHIHGRIPDLDPMLRTCRLALAPLRYGAGVKGKINMAMSHGVPVVATPMATEGMFLTDGQNVLVADTAADFAEAVVRAYGDPALWRTLSIGGIENVRRHFSFDAARDCLGSIFGAMPPLPK